MSNGNSIQLSRGGIVRLHDYLAVTGIDAETAHAIHDAADEGGTIQAHQMAALFRGRPECHTTCSIRQALRWAGATIVGGDD